MRKNKNLNILENDAKISEMISNESNLEETGRTLSTQYRKKGAILIENQSSIKSDSQGQSSNLRKPSSTPGQKISSCSGITSHGEIDDISEVDEDIKTESKMDESEDLKSKSEDLDEMELS